MTSIEEAAEKLSEMASEREGLEEKFSDIQSIEKDSTVKEGFLKKDVEPIEPGRVAGVDGGIVKKRYSSGDIVAVRAVAAFFTNHNPVEVEYIPSRNPEPEFHVIEAGDQNSLERKAEAERVRAEIEAVDSVTERAGTVFIDGSIVPSYLEDEKVLDTYSGVFEEADDGSLVGVIEDSYGLKLSSILEQKLGIDIGKTRDTLVMDALLDEGERSFVRRFSDSPVEHPLLQKLEDRHVNRIHTFYVKLSSSDIPLRIDYLGEVGQADRIAGKLMELKSSKRYTVPSPIVEADRRAKISENYVKRLEKRFSPGMKRRDRRIF